MNVIELLNKKVPKAAGLILPDGEITMDNVERALPKIIAIIKLDEEYDGSPIDKDIVKNIIIADRTISVIPSTSIQNDEDGANWLKEYRLNLPWKFWRDYERSLSLPLAAIREIDLTTNYILDRMCSPRKEGNWYRAGLVVGHVQSGKTGNYIGLINKAMDVGYKLILVFTGTFNDLRSQTQSRIDKDAIGKITNPDVCNYGEKIGVGSYNHPKVINLTSSNINGDFGSLKTDIGGVLGGTDPTIMVCKKNSSILSNILKLFSQAATRGEDGLPIINDFPLLMIDDECDSASINVAFNKNEIAAINRKMRAVLGLFTRRAYVGYTATPYANIFMSPDPDNKREFIEDEFRGSTYKYRLNKEDLFPKNFIINLNAPSNYIGPNVLFGISENSDEEGDEEEKKELPIIDYIKDGYESVKKNDVPDFLPQSLKEAIRSFIVATAIRRARGQKRAHSSMLINVSQYVDWMDQIGLKVQEYTYELCEKCQQISNFPLIEKELKRVYDNKFKPSHDTICEDHKEWANKLRWPDWDEVVNEIPIVAIKLFDSSIDLKGVRVIHSKRSDTDEDLNVERLNYSDFENLKPEINNGLYVIAVGGNVLARGLTLEGLTISYFFRCSKTFDTLMQMGRWFGYRDGYVDVCRLYVSEDVANDFYNISVATQRMREDFNDLCERGIKPKDYGLKVMTFPGSLEATARNKFGVTVRGQLSLSKTTLQASQLFRREDIITHNKEVVMNFLGKLGHSRQFERHHKAMPHFFWTCGANEVLEFIDSFKTATIQMPKHLIKAYIENQNKKGNLLHWTVALVSNQIGCEEWSHDTLSNNSVIEHICCKPIKRTSRTDSEIHPETNMEKGFYTVKNAAVIQPVYESLDLTDEQYDKALNQSVEVWQDAVANGKSDAKEPTVPYGKQSKTQRPSENGLLILLNVDFNDGRKDIFSYAISMPDVGNDSAIKYEFRGQPNAFENPDMIDNLFTNDSGELQYE